MEDDSTHHQALSRTRKGFALVVTLSLMILLTIIAVGLLSLSSIALRSSSQEKAVATARSNARMALMLAIGELQKHSGPDQRTTGTADLAGDSQGKSLANDADPQNSFSVGAPDGTRTVADSGNGLTKVQAGTRYWTGVWGNRDAPSDIYKQTPSPVLLNWLVSGNESTPAFTAAIDGQISATPATAPTSLPSDAVSNLSPSTSALSTDLALGTQRATLLVGRNTVAAAATPTTADLNNYVVAPLVEVRNSTGTRSIGRYAWWVGDEGVKAKYNVVDPYAANTDPSTDAKARYRLLSPAHTGVDLLNVAGTNSYPTPKDADHGLLAKVTHLGQAQLLSTGFTPYEIRSRFHSLTTTSSGLLTDTLKGGLRQDLTYALEQTALPPSLAGQTIIPGTHSPATGPYWENLQSYYNADVTGTGASATVACQAQTQTQMGIAPVITQVRMFFSVDNSTLTVGSQNNVYLRANVIFVLANPYNVTLTAPAGGVDFTISSPGSLDKDSYVVFLTRDIVVDGFQAFGVIRAPKSWKAGKDKGLLDVARFHVDSFSIAPGKTAVFSVSGTGQTVDSTLPVGAPLDQLNEVTLIEGLPPSGTYQNNYYSIGTPWVVNLPLTGISEQDDPAKIGFSLREAGLGAGATFKMIESSSGKVIQQIGRQTVRNQNQARTQNGHTNLGEHLYKFRGPARGKYNKELNSRTYQDYNVRGAFVEWATVTAGPSIYIPAPPNYAPSTKFPNVTGILQSPAFSDDLIPSDAVLWAEDSIASRPGPSAAGVFFDLPPANGTAPRLLSLAQLQHASLTANDSTPGYYNQPSYAFASSYSNPFVERRLTVQTRVNTTTTGSSRYFDISYLLNAALWDGYYFSSVPQTGAVTTPLNPRYLVAPNSTGSDLRQMDAAASLRVDGMFNINSTSTEAWVALLGGLHNLATPTDTAKGTVFARSLWQPGTSAAALKGTGTDAYTGLRRLDQAQVEKLAAAIVQRVRARGPFVSLAQFLNRTLVAASTDFNPVINDASNAGAKPLCNGTSIPMGRGLSGTLQAAIDHAGRNPGASLPDGGLNDFSGGGVSPSGAKASGDRVQFNNKTDQYFKTNVYFADRDNEDPNYPNQNDSKVGAPGPPGRRSTAIPGWLLQGDVLQSLGSVLSARSDTFTIRSYGEARDPLNPSAAAPPAARAWCEAVVQRVPDYVVPGENNSSSTPSVASPTNRAFGRNFKIVSFRWLTPDDI